MPLQLITTETDLKGDFMFIMLKKSKVIKEFSLCLRLSILLLCLNLTSCYSLYPAPSGPAGGSSPSGGGNTIAQAQPGSNTSAAAPAAPVVPPEPPPLTGTLVPGDTLTEKLAWLQRSADSHNIYILEVTANENISPATLSYRGAINITIALRGDEENRTIRLRSHGAMFTINQNVTFVLENNITLQGHSGNSDGLVKVEGGTFHMRTGATITGNTSTNYYGGGGVHLVGGTFEMTGGTISGNSAVGSNGSAYVFGHGGGVYVGNYFGYSPSVFIMNGGSIENNNARSNGGGVFINGTFTLRGGTISGNTAGEMGGGVSGGDFTMNGGTIASNVAGNEGGGVYLDWQPLFAKTGGTITGYNSDPVNGNVVKDGSGNVLARRGHAIMANAYYSSGRQETTAGPVVRLTARSYDFSGSWDQPGSGGVGRDGTR